MSHSFTVMIHSLYNIIQFRGHDFRAKINMHNRAISCCFVQFLGFLVSEIFLNIHEKSRILETRGDGFF